MISEVFEPALLRTFVSICQLGNLTHAAEAAGRKQSALSAQIRRLEDAVGQRLLRRTGRGVVPTTEGEVLLSYATRILALGDAAADRLNERAVSGTVRIGLSEDVAKLVLPTAFARIKRAFPDMHLEITVDSDSLIATRWKEGAFDIVLGPAQSFNDNPISTWDVRLEWAIGIDAAFDPEAPLDIITYAEPCIWRRQIFETLAESDRPYRLAVTSASLSVIVAAVEAGLGIALLPLGEIRSQTMRMIDPMFRTHVDPVVTYGVFVRKRPDASIRAAMEMIVGSGAESADWSRNASSGLRGPNR